MLMISFLKFVGGTWDKLQCKVRQKIPFIPLETEIDQLVAGCSKTVRTALQVAKETGARRA